MHYPAGNALQLGFEQCYWSLVAPNACPTNNSATSVCGEWEPVPVVDAVPAQRADSGARRSSYEKLVAASSGDDSSVRLVCGSVPGHLCSEPRCSMTVLYFEPAFGRMTDHLLWIEEQPDEGPLTGNAVFVMEKATHQVEIGWTQWSINLRLHPHLQFIAWEPPIRSAAGASLMLHPQNGGMQLAWVELQFAAGEDSALVYLLSAKGLQRLQLTRRHARQWEIADLDCIETVVPLPTPVHRILRWIRPFVDSDKAVVLLHENQICSLPSAQRIDLSALIQPKGRIDDVVALTDDRMRQVWLARCVDGTTHAIEVDASFRASPLPMIPTYRMWPSGRLEATRPPIPRVYVVRQPRFPAVAMTQPDAVTASIDGDRASLARHADEGHPGGAVSLSSPSHGARSESGPSRACTVTERDSGGMRSPRLLPGNFVPNPLTQSLSSKRSGSACSDVLPTEDPAQGHSSMSMSMTTAVGESAPNRSLDKRSTHRFAAQRILYSTGSGVCLVELDVSSGAVREHMVVDGVVTGLCFFDSREALVVLRLPGDPLMNERIACFPAHVVHPWLTEGRQGAWPFAPPCSMELMLDAVTEIAEDRQARLQEQHEQLERTLLAMRPAPQYAYLLGKNEHDRERLATLFSVGVRTERGFAEAPSLRVAIRLSSEIRDASGSRQELPSLSDACSFVVHLGAALEAIPGPLAGACMDNLNVVRCIPAGDWVSATEERVMLVPLPANSHAPVRLLVLLCFHGRLEDPEAASAAVASASGSEAWQLAPRGSQAWWLVLTERHLDVFDLVERVTGADFAAALPLAPYHQKPTWYGDVPILPARKRPRCQRLVAGIPGAVLRETFPSCWSNGDDRDTATIFVETLLGSRFQVHIQRQDSDLARFQVQFSGPLDVISWARVALRERCDRHRSRREAAEALPVSGGRAASRTPHLVDSEFLKAWLGARTGSSAPPSYPRTTAMPLRPTPAEERHLLAWIRDGLATFSERLESAERVYGIIAP